MIFRKEHKTKEIIIYNYDLKTQQMSLLYRGEKTPVMYQHYPRLWRLKDKRRQIETIIIAI